MPGSGSPHPERTRLITFRRALGLGVGLALLVPIGLAPIGLGAYRYALSKRAQVLDAWRERLTAMADDRAAALEAWLGERWGDAREVASFSSVSTKGLAARSAVQGRKTFGEFTDYRGIPVLAATRPIRGTTWGLVVKVDRSEALAPYHGEMIRQGLLLLAVLITLMGIGYGLWRRQRMRALKAVVAERERSETRILQLNRLLRTISEINQLIVREQDRERLLAEACRILVDSGMFRMAWVGFKDEAAGTVAPAASSEGARAYLDGVTVRWDDSPPGRGPTGTAIRENRHVLNLDVTTNPAVAPWREAVLRAGYRSSAAFPIRVREVVVGALSVYADRPHAFGEEEVALLDELAGDLGYALQAMEERRGRLAVERALRENEAELKEAQRVARLGSWTMDSRTGAVTWSSELYRMLDLDPNSPAVPYQEQARLFAPESWERLRAAIGDTLETGIPYELELELARPDGSRGWMFARGEPVRDRDGVTTGLRGIAQDITERKEAEIALRESEERFALFMQNLPAMAFIKDAGQPLRVR